MSQDPYDIYKDFIEQYLWAVEPFAHCALRIKQWRWIRYFCSDCIDYIARLGPVIVAQQTEVTTPEGTESIFERLRVRAYQAQGFVGKGYSDFNLLFVVNICGLLEEAVRRFLSSWLSQDPQLIVRICSKVEPRIQSRLMKDGNDTDAQIKYLEGIYCKGKEGIDRFESLLMLFGLPQCKCQEDEVAAIAEMFNVRHRIAHSGGAATTQFARQHPTLIPLNDPTGDFLDIQDFLPIEISLATERLEKYLDSAFAYICNVESRVRAHLVIPDRLS